MDFCPISRISILRLVSYFMLLASNIVSARTKNNPNHKLILISLDGFRWDYLNGRAETPTFDFIKQAGVHARKGIQSVFITNTLPNHFSMVTGLYVEAHGMLDNKIFDPLMAKPYIPVFYDHDVFNDPDWLKYVGEPIWVSHSKQNGGKTGVLMWMGGETPIEGISPTKFILHTYKMDEMTEISHLIDWVTSDDNDSDNEKENIDLAVVYFPEPDSSGHLYGPDSVQVTRKIEILDEAIGRLLSSLRDKGLENSTDIIITSDHGFTNISPNKAIQIDDILNPSHYMSVSYLPGPMLGIFPHEGYSDEIYGNLKAASDRLGNFQVYKKEDIPPRFHYKKHRRTPPIVATASIGYSFVNKANMDGFQELVGNHGYDNSLQEMKPFFVAIGPSFKEGASVETFPIVDIYPLMCHIKGIRPQPNNGSMDIVSSLLRHYPDNQPSSSVYCFPNFTLIIGVTLLCLGIIVVSRRSKHQRQPKQE